MKPGELSDTYEISENLFAPFQDLLENQAHFINHVADHYHKEDDRILAVAGCELGMIGLDIEMIETVLTGKDLRIFKRGLKLGRNHIQKLQDIFIDLSGAIVPESGG